MTDLAALFDRLAAPIRRRLAMMVTRGVAELVDDSKGVQVVQASNLRADNLADGAERFQQFGFTSVPLAGAELLVLHVGGDAGHPIVVAIDDRRYRPKSLAEGESAMYTAQDGVRVHAKADGSVEIGTSPTDLVALSSKVESELTKVALAFSTFIPGTGGASFPNPYTTPAAGATAATQVKAK